MIAEANAVLHEYGAAPAAKSRAALTHRSEWRRARRTCPVLPSRILSLFVPPEHCPLEHVRSRPTFSWNGLVHDTLIAPPEHVSSSHHSPEEVDVLSPARKANIEALLSRQGFHAGTARCPSCILPQVGLRPVLYSGRSQNPPLMIQFGGASSKSGRAGPRTPAAPSSSQEASIDASQPSTGNSSSSMKATNSPVAWLSALFLVNAMLRHAIHSHKSPLCQTVPRTP